MTEIESLSEEQLERNLIRSVAREEIATLIEGRKLLSEQHSQSFRWLMASLLTINSGAIVACLNSDAIESSTKVTAGATFAVGVALALMVAYSSQKLSNALIPSMQEKIGYWLGVLEHGELEREADEVITGKAKRVLRFRFVPEIFGWLSLAAFFGGLGSIGAQLDQADERASTEEVSANVNGTQIDRDYQRSLTRSDR